MLTLYLFDFFYLHKLREINTIFVIEIYVRERKYFYLTVNYYNFY